MNCKRQKGIVLVISLVLLVVITLFVLSSTRLATGNLRIIGNMQAKKAVEAVAQQAVEQVISNINWFDDPTATVTVTPPSGMTVTVGNRICIGVAVPGGSSDTLKPPGAVGFEYTYWNVNVAVADSITGARTVVNQGVRILKTIGNCV